MPSTVIDREAVVSFIIGTGGWPDVVRQDNIAFQVMSVQEFIFRAKKVLGAEHQEYLDYLSERYL